MRNAVDAAVYLRRCLDIVGIICGFECREVLSAALLRFRGVRIALKCFDFPVGLRQPVGLGKFRAITVAVVPLAISHDIVGHLLVLQPHVAKQLLRIMYQIGMIESFYISSVLILRHHKVDCIWIPLHSRI